MTGLFIFLSCLVLSLSAYFITKTVTATQLELRTRLNEQELSKLHKQLSNELETLLTNHKNWVRLQEETNQALIAQNKELLVLFKTYHSDASEVLSQYRLMQQIHKR